MVYKRTHYIFDITRKFWTWQDTCTSCLLNLIFFFNILSSFFFFIFYPHNRKAVFVRVSMNCNFPITLTNNIVLLFVYVILFVPNLYLLVLVSNISGNSSTQPFYKMAAFRILVIDTKNTHYVKHFIKLFNFVGFEMVLILLVSLLTGNLNHFKNETQLDAMPCFNILILHIVKTGNPLIFAQHI